MTIWKTIPDFPDFEVSNEGQVRYKGGWQYSSRCRVPWQRPPYIVTPVYDKDRYLKVRLLRNGKRTKKAIHRLVALAFVPIIPGKGQVNHIDGVKTNNRASNLEWTDSKGNHHHRRHVLLKNIGDEHGKSKLTADIVRAIRAMPGSVTHAELARQFNVTQQAIGYARRGETWRHLLD